VHTFNAEGLIASAMNQSDLSLSMQWYLSKGYIIWAISGHLVIKPRKDGDLKFYADYSVTGGDTAHSLANLAISKKEEHDWAIICHKIKMNDEMVKFGNEPRRGSKGFKIETTDT